VRRPPFRRVLAAFLLREVREALSYKAAIAIQLAGLLLALGALYYLARFIGVGRSAELAAYGSDYLGFALLGFILTELQQVAVGSFAQRVRNAQLAGTLEAMLATPARPWQILVAAPIGDFLEAAIRALSYLLIGWLGFGLHLQLDHAAPAIAAVALAMGAFVGLGLCAAAAAMLLRKSEPIGWAVSGLSVLVAGVVYPTAVLPGWLRGFGQALPITHALETIRRALLGGAGAAELARPLLVLAGFAACLLPLGLLAFAAALRRTRIDGSLTHY
jgi:ABC-2 type transport system permease protein